MSLSDLIEGGELGVWQRAGDDEYNILCPNPDHPDSRLGSCFVNTSKNVFICYSCDAKGHANRALRWLGISGELEESARPVERIKKKSPVHFLDDVVLHAWRYEPTEWLDAGITAETLLAHEVGYDFFNKRITIPIRDRHSRLIAISGRATEEWQKPRYKFYGPKELLDYAPSDYRAARGTVLWRHHLLSSPRRVVVVEGFKGAMWLVQHGHPDVVSTMGKSVSSQQSELLAAMRVPVIIFFDGDMAGRKGQQDLGITLYRLGVSVYYAAPDDSYTSSGLSPDDLSRDQLTVALDEATPHRLTGRQHGKQKLEPAGSIFPEAQSGTGHSRRRRRLSL